MPTAAASRACSRCCAASCTPKPVTGDARGWRIAPVAQETPAWREPAIDFVLDGDAELRASRGRWRAADAAHDGERLAELHARLERHRRLCRARPRASPAAGLGFDAGELERPVAAFLRRLAHAPEPRARADEPLRPAAARRADQPPRPRRGGLARATGCALTRARCCWSRTTATSSTASSRTSRTSSSGALTLYTGNYCAFEDAARRAPRRAAGDVREAAARDRAHDSFVDAFPRQGHQGAPGAEPASRRWTGWSTSPPAHVDAPFDFRVSPTARDARPAAGARGRGGRLRRARRCSQTSSCRCVRATRIGLLGPTAPASPRWSRSLAGELPLLAGRAFAGKGLRIGYFAQHQLEQLRPDEITAAASAAARAARARAGTAQLPRRLRLPRRHGGRAGRAASPAARSRAWRWR